MDTSSINIGGIEKSARSKAGGMSGMNGMGRMSGHASHDAQSSGSMQHHDRTRKLGLPLPHPQSHACRHVSGLGVVAGLVGNEGGVSPR